MRLYRPPEVLLGLKHTPALDMWALGCLLLELNAGYPPVACMTNAERLSFMEEFIGKVPMELEEISLQKYIFKEV